MNLFLGFDPGGKGNFGWSICREVGGYLQPGPITGLENDAWSALERVGKLVGSYKNVCVRPVGIDAPLLWDKRGTRKADSELSKALTRVRKTLKKESVVRRPPVQAVNSLQGACTIQGTLLARHLIEKSESWKCQNLAITESHPKALEYLLANSMEHQRHTK